jgi:hypothetical protein
VKSKNSRVTSDMFSVLVVLSPSVRKLIIFIV